MKNLTTSDYIKLLVVHNCQILFNKFQMEFYKLFDWFEMIWFTRVQRRGTYSDYHLQKLAKSMAANDESGLMSTLRLMNLLDKLQYSEQDKRRIGYMFYLPAYLRFIFNRELLNQMSIIMEVKDNKTLLDAGDHLGLRFRQKFTMIHGADALAEYELIQKENNP